MQKEGWRFDMFPPLDPKIRKSILKIVQDQRIVGILGICGLLWTSTWVFSSLGSALNIIFRVEKDRSILRGKAIDFFLLFLAGTLLLMSMALSSAVTLFQGYLFKVPPGYWLHLSAHPEIRLPIPFYVLHVFLDLQDRPQYKNTHRDCAQGHFRCQHFMGACQTIVWLVYLAPGEILGGL